MLTKKARLLPLLLLPATLFAQNMSSPYSIYGIGDIDHRYYNANSGMGYTGLALKTGLFGNGNNPASATGLDKSFFMVDVNTAGRSVTYAGDAIDAENRANQDFAIKRLALAVKLNSFWASGIGMRQFSKVNYSFQSTKTVEGTGSKLLINYSGDGGLNEYYWNNAFSIGRHFSVGINTSFIAGPINQTETITDDVNTFASTRRDYYANGRLEYGMIYSGSLSKKWNLSIGGRYARQTTMNYERSLTVTQNTTTTLVDNEFVKYAGFQLPRSYGAGIALTTKNGTRTIAADYSASDWAGLDVKGSGWKLVNSSRISTGMEFASFTNAFNRNVQKKSFQLGAFLDNSYLAVNGHQIMEWGVTTGLARTLKSGLVIGGSVEGGIRGTTQAGLIRENYFQFNLNFSYRDFIFSKGRKYN